MAKATSMAMKYHRQISAMHLQISNRCRLLLKPLAWGLPEFVEDRGGSPCGQWNRSWAWSGKVGCLEASWRYTEAIGGDNWAYGEIAKAKAFSFATSPSEINCFDKPVWLQASRVSSPASRLFYFIFSISDFFFQLPSLNQWSMMILMFPYNYPWPFSYINHYNLRLNPP